MFQQLDELEQRIGYRFHNRDYLRRALTCESAINERNPDAASQNFQALEYVGDAALKYAVTTLLYMQQSYSESVEELNIRTLPFIGNSNLSRIGQELNLSKYIIKDRGVGNITNNMLVDAVEAILGGIVIDQQEQGNDSEKVLFDVITCLFSIKRKDRPTIYQTFGKVSESDSTAIPLCELPIKKYLPFSLSQMSLYIFYLSILTLLLSTEAVRKSSYQLYRFYIIIKFIFVMTLLFLCTIYTLVNRKMTFMQTAIVIPRYDLTSISIDTCLIYAREKMAIYILTIINVFLFFLSMECSKVFSFFKTMIIKV